MDGHVGRSRVRVQLRTAGAAEVFASDEAGEKFAHDNVAAWDKVMNLDRFDRSSPAAPPAASIWRATGRRPTTRRGASRASREVPLDDLGRAQAVELAERAVAYGFAACGAARCGARAKPPKRSLREIGLSRARTPASWRPMPATGRIARSQSAGRSARAVRAFANAEPDFAFPGGESFVAQEHASPRRSTTSKRARCRRWWSVTAWSFALRCRCRWALAARRPARAQRGAGAARTQRGRTRRARWRGEATQAS